MSFSVTSKADKSHVVFYGARSKIRRWIDESPSTRDPRLLAYYCRRFGILKTLGIGIYDCNFFAEQKQLQQAYTALAQVIFLAFRPSSVCDLGCGNGFLIDFLKQQGVRVKGVEGSKSALPHVPETVKADIVISSVTRPLSLGLFDLVISTEVAEHVPKRQSTRLVDNMVRHATKGLFFTAAHPGQWGDGHINCQSKDYWKGLFAQRGWFVCETLQSQLEQAIRSKPEIDKSLPWVSQNLMALTPTT
jgi:SAM-dependent methyltransferase